MIGWLVVAAVIGCVGAWLVATGFRQQRPALAATARRLRRTDRPETAAAARPASQLARVGGSVLRLIDDRDAISGPDDAVHPRLHRWTRALRLVGRTLDEHVGLLVLAAVVGAIVPVLVVAGLQWVGAVSLGIFVPVGLALVCAALAALLVHSDMIERADTVRRDVRHQLSSYLDMVSMLLAGNTGHEGALDHAARAGDGILFRELRRRMREAAASGSSLVTALAAVGSDYGIDELEQVAATASLSAAEGAPVARALAAKCATLRSTLAADDEAAARVRNDKVTPPLVGMALLFMALIIYPALNLG
jgi:Flp pilus assembly protein TadB